MFTWMNFDPSFLKSVLLSSEEFKVMNNGKLLETMERSQVYREAHEGAILINKGETYAVDNVNLKSGYVNVSKKKRKTVASYRFPMLFIYALLHALQRSWYFAAAW